MGKGNYKLGSQLQLLLAWPISCCPCIAHYAVTCATLACVPFDMTGTYPDMHLCSRSQFLNMTANADKREPSNTQHLATSRGDARCKTWQLLPLEIRTLAPSASSVARKSRVGESVAAMTGPAMTPSRLQADTCGHAVQLGEAVTARVLEQLLRCTSFQ